jgi:hypothetical protein
MLHDPGSYTPPQEITKIELSNIEKDVLKGLAEELATIAEEPAHAEKARLWTRMNDLKSERPMVWIDEIPWHEMNINDELTLQCQDSWARELETKMRRTIYQWKHMPGDMVVDDFLACPLAIHSTDFGIIEDVDVAKTDETSGIVSRHFNTQINNPEDIEKIKMPTVTHNEKVMEICYEAMVELFSDIMPVKKMGQTHIWFTPWDYLIRWWGIQEAMMDLLERPQMVHDGVERMVQAWMVELDQFEEQNLLALDNNNTRVGSGGYGYSSELPGDNIDANWIRPKNMWGCSNAQIFTQVSPQMHWDFAIEHELKWLERWGLNYYGCCEPLDHKMEQLRKIPNLRKISISPWCKMERAMDEVGQDYVMSIKPSPAIFAEDSWSPQKAKAIIKEILDLSQGQHHIEFIMKDVSTVRYEPQRLWEWESILMDLVQ